VSTTLKQIETLTVKDLEAHPVWEYVNDDQLGETSVRPLKQIPVRNLTGKEVGTQVRLANGNTVWALIGNVDDNNARMNEHFLTISLERHGKWFFLSRYFDVDYSENGPEALARFLGLDVDEVFPISYDITRYADGNRASLVGSILKEPREKLTRAQLIALAVPQPDGSE